MALAQLPAGDKSSLNKLTTQYFDVVPGRSAFFRRSLLQERHWIAVLFECDFKDDALKIAAAASARRWTRAICYNVEYPEDKAFELVLTEQDLRSVHNIYPSPSYAIVEHDGRFAIISDSDYFWAVAGPVNFIRDLCNQAVSAELDIFSQGIQSYLLSSDVHNRTIGEQMFQYLEQCRALFAECVD